MNGFCTLGFAFDPWTYALVALVALLLFGKRLPEVGRSLGRGIAEFKRGMRDVQDEMMKDDEDGAATKPKLRPPASTDETAHRQLSGDAPGSPSDKSPTRSPDDPG